MQWLEQQFNKKEKKPTINLWYRTGHYFIIAWSGRTILVVSQLNLTDLHLRPCSILMIPLLGRRFCIVSPSLYTLLATTDPHSVPLKTTWFLSPPPFPPKSSDPHQEINNDRSLWARYERLWSLTDDAEEAKTTSNPLNWCKHQFPLEENFPQKNT